MKDYNLWACGLWCGMGISSAIIGDYISTGVCVLVAMLTFVTWRTFKW